MDLSFPSGYSVIDGIFLKILTCIWVNIISYNYPGLTGLSNSSMREVVTVLFSRKTCAELIVSFPLIRKITIYCTRFSLSGQILFWNSLSFWFTFLGKILSTWELWRAWKRHTVRQEQLRPLECSLNFPSAQYLDKCTAGTWTNCFITLLKRPMQRLM